MIASKSQVAVCLSQLFIVTVSHPYIFPMLSLCDTDDNVKKELFLLS